MGAAFAQCGLYLIGKISCRTDVEDVANGKGWLLCDVVCPATFADSTVNISAYIAGNGLACPVSSIGSGGLIVINAHRVTIVLWRCRYWYFICAESDVCASLFVLTL